MKVLGVFFGVLQCDCVRKVTFLSFDRDDIFVHNITGTVQVLDKLLDPSLVEELFGKVGTVVSYSDSHTAVQERQLLKTLDQRVVRKFGDREDLAIRLKGRFRPLFGGGTRFPNRPCCNPSLVRLRVDPAVAVDFDFAPLGKEVHYRNADPVETTGMFVRLLLKFPAELEDGHYPFEGRHLFLHQFGKLCMAICWDSSSIVLDRYRSIRVDGYGNSFRVPRHRFIDGVIHHFVDQMMKSMEVRIPDVHTRTFAHVLQVIEVL